MKRANASLGRAVWLWAVAGVLAGTGCASGGGPTEMVATPTPQAAPDLPPADVTLMVDLDTVRAGEFDNGKMWTFEYPPLDYFEAAYGFRPDHEWLERARLGTLRIPGCTASFVSPDGLVLTNHHCARGSVIDLSGPEEDLLETGFVAASRSEERRIPDYRADQLIEIVDVTDAVHAALRGRLTVEQQEAAREAATDSIAGALSGERGGGDAGIVVEVTSLWNGARYSAYIFRRYTDVRLVMAPEYQIGHFGGDPDNFTYPRYNLDFSLLRVYQDGEPLSTEHFFRWSTEGYREGDPVFVTGNPGSTSRLETVSQLMFRRDVSDKTVYHFIESRLAALREFFSAHPEVNPELGIRNRIFSLMNSGKAYGGIWRGLHDPVLIAKRRDAERAFLDSINQDLELRSSYGDLFEQMNEIQRAKRSFAADYAAFFAWGNPSYTSSAVQRALAAYQYHLLLERGASQETLSSIEAQYRAVRQQPMELQEVLLRERLADLERHLKTEGPGLAAILRGGSPAQLARQIVSESDLVSAESAERLWGRDSLLIEDPALELVAAIFERYVRFQQVWIELESREAAVAFGLGRARFDVFGTSIPPDATFSLRLQDGVIKGYQYNGTIAPIQTTLFGLYDHYYSYGADSDWRLPERWLDPPEEFDLSTPLNFVATADIIGGNSGSPVLNRDLEVLGVAFDGNMESLPGDFIFVPEANRMVSVDVRAILEALDDIYQADHLVSELMRREPLSIQSEVK